MGQALELRDLLVANDFCPECGGELDTGFECQCCGFDAYPVRMGMPDLVLANIDWDKVGE